MCISKGESDLLVVKSQEKVEMFELHLFAVRSCILNVSGQYLRHNTDS